MGLVEGVPRGGPPARGSRSAHRGQLQALRRGVQVRLIRLLVAAALLAVAGTSIAPAGATIDDVTDREAIAELLDRRERALLARDRDAFMATVADDSPDFVRRQRAFFRWVGNVPLSSYELDVAWWRFGDLVREEDRARYPSAEDVSIPVTEERYRISGFDAEPAAEDLFYTYVKRGGEWLIAEDTALDELTMFTGRHLWDSGPVYKRRSRSFILFGHPCRGASSNNCASVDDSFLDLAEQGLKQVARYWPVRWHKRVAVLVPGSGDELERMIQSTFDLDKFVAFAYSSVDVGDGIDYTGHRIIPNPSAFQGRASGEVREILAHELLHVATRVEAGPFVPIFVDEGYADYVGHDGDPGALAFLNAEVAAGIFDAQLPEDYQFTIGSGTDIFRSYQKSHSAVRYFIERYGLQKFVRFYRGLGRVEIAPGTVRFHVDRVLRKTVGLTLPAFERAWADSIRGS